MTNVRTWLAGGIVVVLGAMLFALSGFQATEVAAESPPNPPARFVGSVTVDGVAVPAGTLIEARVGSTTCGVTTTFNSGAQARYVVDVPALDPGATPNCGTDGAVVTFRIADKLAAQTGTWHNYQLNTVNLTFTSPTATPTAAATTPGGTTTATTTTTTGTTTTATPRATPRAPSTGSGHETGSSAAIWLIAALGAGAFAFGVGGAAAVRRSR